MTPDEVRAVLDACAQAEIRRAFAPHFAELRLLKEAVELWGREEN